MLDGFEAVHVSIQVKCFPALAYEHARSHVALAKYMKIVMNRTFTHSYATRPGRERGEHNAEEERKKTRENNRASVTLGIFLTKFMAMRRGNAAKPNW